MLVEKYNETGSNMNYRVVFVSFALMDDMLFLAKHEVFSDNRNVKTVSETR